jgi:putative heme iron utilization protein
MCFFTSLLAATRMLEREGDGSVDGDRSASYLTAAAALLVDMRTVHLATVSEQGVPHASVAPFVCRDGAIFVYVSALAAHTANLRACRQACVLLARDEAASPELFARPRLTLQCAVAEQARGSAVWHAVLDALEARFGATAATVRHLPDFVLFRLEPREARIVTGFARAQRIDGAAVAAMCRAPEGA